MIFVVMFVVTFVVMVGADGGPYVGKLSTTRLDLDPPVCGDCYAFSRGSQ
jgi:hypothetical protein